MRSLTAPLDDRTSDVGREVHGRGLELVFYPLLHVAPPVADMSAHSETGGSFSAVAPLVEGGNGDAEVFGELLDCEEPVPVFHAVDHQQDPVDSMSLVAQAGMTGLSKGFLTLC